LWSGSGLESEFFAASENGIRTVDGGEMAERRKRQNVTTTLPSFAYKYYIFVLIKTLVTMIPFYHTKLLYPSTSLSGSICCVFLIDINIDNGRLA